MCYYFNDIIKLEDFNFDNILIDEKSPQNILIYDISCKTLIGPKPLHIRFDKIDGFIRIYGGTRFFLIKINITIITMYSEKNVCIK